MPAQWRTARYDQFILISGHLSAPSFPAHVETSPSSVLVVPVAAAWCFILACRRGLDLHLISVAAEGRRSV